MTQPTRAKRVVDGVELKAVAVLTVLIAVIGGGAVALAGIAGFAWRVFQATSGG